MKKSIDIYLLICIWIWLFNEGHFLLYLFLQLLCNIEGIGGAWLYMVAYLKWSCLICWVLLHIDNNHFSSDILLFFDLRLIYQGFCLFLFIYVYKSSIICFLIWFTAVIRWNLPLLYLIRVKFRFKAWFFKLFEFFILNLIIIGGALVI